MLSLDAKSLSPVQLQQYLQYAIAPRPICFASTINAKGEVNLSPFSFFNLMGSNPPTCVFSPARRVRDNTTKHSLENVMEVPECVINIVNYDMVQQMSLASTEYGSGVNEFIKAGFTAIDSTQVKPPRVAEAPVQLECIVKQVIPLGDQHGAGNLIVAEIVKIHIHEHILDGNGLIDQAKIDLVARLGGDWYCRITEANLFKVAKPLTTLGIGVDALPEAVRLSTILSGNDLGQLGNLETLPDSLSIEAMRRDADVSEILKAEGLDETEKVQKLQLLAKSIIAKGDIEKALKILFL
ncbi:MAG: flavin reductase family protein [Pedobacter sp.]|nr:MAG: flavin reductase family protein [Pedobacter sp.]